LRIPCLPATGHSAMDLQPKNAKNRPVFAKKTPSLRIQCLPATGHSAMIRRTAGPLLCIFRSRSAALSSYRATRVTPAAGFATSSRPHFRPTHRPTFPVPRNMKRGREAGFMARSSREPCSLRGVSPLPEMPTQTLLVFPPNPLLCHTSTHGKQRQRQKRS